MRPFRYTYLLLICAQIAVTLLATMTPLLAKAAIDKGIRPGRLDLLTIYCVSSILVSLIAGLLNAGLEYGHENVSARFTAALRVALFANVQRRPYSFFGRIPLGTIQGRLHDDVDAIYTVVVNLCLDIVNEALQILVIGAILCSIDWQVGALVLISLPILAGIVSRSSRHLKLYSLHAREAGVALLDFLQDRLDNVYLIKSLRREAVEDECYSSLNDTAVKAILARVRVRFYFLFASGLLIAIVPVALLWLGGYRVVDHRLTMGSLFACYMYSIRLFAPVQDMLTHIASIASSLVSAELLQEYVGSPLPPVRQMKNEVNTDSLGAALKFTDVTFRHEGAAATLLRQVSFAVQARDKVAIIGPSGSGKTTIANILARLYVPTQGSILIAGVPVEAYSDAAYSDLVGIAPQEPQLFDISILENIRLGRPSATDAEVWEAARRMQLERDLKKMSDELNTRVGHRGTMLSGGQRQRIALARLFLQRPQIMILDEATSGLDRSTEAAVLTELMRLDRTTILITHRESVTAFAHRTFTMLDGTLAETSERIQTAHISKCVGNGGVVTTFTTNSRAEA
jgi:ABC-type multidrug transport system fused ATPase/permease subunit